MPVRCSPSISPSLLPLPSFLRRDPPDFSRFFRMLVPYLTHAVRNLDGNPAPGQGCTRGVRLAFAGHGDAAQHPQVSQCVSTTSLVLCCWSRRCCSCCRLVVVVVVVVATVGAYLPNYMDRSRRLAMIHLCMRNIEPYRFLLVIQVLFAAPTSCVATTRSSYKFKRKTKEAQRVRHSEQTRTRNTEKRDSQGSLVMIPHS